MSTRKDNPRPEDASASHAEAVKTAHHSMRKWVSVLAVFVAASWVLIGVVMFQNRTPAIAKGAMNSSAATRPMVAGAGPWGQLEYTPIVISPPLEYVEENELDFSEPVAWHFPNVGSERFARLLKETGLAAPLAAELKSMAKANFELPGMSIYPSKEFLLGLSAEARAKLYLALYNYRCNRKLHTQFLFRGNTPDQWFAGSTVSPEIRKLVEPLIYRHGNFMYFDDMQSIANSIPSRGQRLELLKTLRRDATFLVHVKVSKKSDIEAMVNYWGRGGRVQDVRPILESLVQRGGEQHINITHLLPPLARRRLYTYPARLISIANTTTNRDCHWTSLNFFKDVPDDKLARDGAIRRETEQNYYRIHGNLQLGDIAVIVDAQNVPVHSATYIADDVFFHRCGSGSSSPWALARGEDLVDYYPRSAKLQIAYYRRKDM